MARQIFQTVALGLAYLSTDVIRMIPVVRCEILSVPLFRPHEIANCKIIEM